MADFQRQTMGAGVRTGADATIDQGLRAYMLKVYNYMASGIAITGIVAYLAFTMAFVQTPVGLQYTELGATLYGSPLKWVIMLAPLGMVFFLSARIQKMSASGAQVAFWIFAGLMGLSLASIFAVYTGNSIARVFFITAAAFGGLSLYGYTTKKDLSGWGSFLIMGLIGIIIAMIVNIFLASSAMQFAISVIGVLVFAGLTAYDTQSIKEMYYAGDGEATMGRKAIMGALRLYLDFINLFLMLLMLFGNRE
ncbi:Inner membrane protein YbhL [hydrothermal vent metagenome]|uniref:Inner membrane protein YbhL n=1 Tax=hydrothermal vent metagenome TaxID=652676 RepID=A0A3B0TFJ3_9ZZZZ